jgi:hypothetical protein
MAARRRESAGRSLFPKHYLNVKFMSEWTAHDQNCAQSYHNYNSWRSKKGEEGKKGKYSGILAFLSLFAFF